MADASRVPGRELIDFHLHPLVPEAPGFAEPLHVECDTRSESNTEQFDRRWAGVLAASPFRLIYNDAMGTHLRGKLEAPLMRDHHRGTIVRFHHGMSELSGS